jgi:hypothetical protein
LHRALSRNATLRTKGTSFELIPPQRAAAWIHGGGAPVALPFLAACDEGESPDLSLAPIFAEVAGLWEEFAELDCPVIFAEEFVCDWPNALPDSATLSANAGTQSFLLMVFPFLVAARS